MGGTGRPAKNAMKHRASLVSRTHSYVVAAAIRLEDICAFADVLCVRRWCQHRSHHCAGEDLLPDRDVEVPLIGRRCKLHCAASR